MIIATRNGKRYEITAEDQREILRLVIANGGDVGKAISAFHHAKFGEELDFGLTPQCRYCGTIDPGPGHKCGGPALLAEAE